MGPKKNNGCINLSKTLCCVLHYCITFVAFFINKIPLKVVNRLRKNVFLTFEFSSKIMNFKIKIT